MTSVFWLSRCTADVPPDDHWLSTEERLVLDGLKTPVRQASWRLGRWTAKQAIRSLLERRGGCVAEPDITIAASADGAPSWFLKDGPGGMPLSISHRADLSLCMITPDLSATVGCDVEYVEPRSEAFVADYFTPSERALVANAPHEERAAVANLVWSAKESAMKARRTGLRMDTHDLVVDTEWIPTASQGWHQLRVHVAIDNSDYDGWWRLMKKHVITTVALPSPKIPVRLDRMAT